MVLIMARDENAANHRAIRVGNLDFLLDSAPQRNCAGAIRNQNREILAEAGVWSCFANAKKWEVVAKGE